MASIVAPSLLLTVLLIALPVFGGEYLSLQVGLYLLYGIAAQGVALAWGRGGFLPLGNALFFGLAGYGTAMALNMTGGALLPSVAAVIVIAIALAAFAWALAAIIFRGRTDSGPFFSLITLSLVLIASQLAETNPDITGGFNGLTGFPPLAGLDPFGNLYYVIAALVLVVSVSLMAIERLPAGLVMRALVSQEPRLQTLGFATNQVKAWIFAGSAFITALAGALFATHQGLVSPPSTGFLLSTEFVIWAAVGGRLHPLGALFGAVAIGMLSAELRDTFAWWEVTIAVVFLLVVLFAPGGAAELFVRFLRKLGLRAKPPTHPATPAPASRAQTSSGALSLDDVDLHAGSVHILRSLSFDAAVSGTLGVIGPNGAGKPTMLKAITGAMPVQSGAVRLGTKDITNSTPHRALDAGIGRKFQIPTVFGGLSVHENLQLAALAARARARDFLRSAALGWQTAPLTRLLETPGVTLAAQGQDDAGTLPQGHRQMLELALTIGAAPKILLLDEPTAGMSPEESALMVRLIQDYQRDTDAFVLVIEHDMSLVEALEARVLVVHQGHALAEGTLQDIRGNDEVTAVYAGGKK
ncbi:MAG: ATP-binding cassette domain-containing protein [Pseudomonadota bacterium]|nr:ATP-binding cassette domain-containing protein [Pseudomonadota bacterium]